MKIRKIEKEKNIPKLAIYNWIKKHIKKKVFLKENQVQIPKQLCITRILLKGNIHLTKIQKLVYQS